MLLRIRAASTGRALAQVASRARPATLRVREMSGPVKVSETGLLDVIAPYEVARTEPLHEMGVLYPPGTPSPMEAVLADGPVIVDGVMAKTGGGPTGHPIEYIRLSQYDPTPVSCKYSGIEFVSQLALDYVANKVAHQAQSALLGSVPSSALRLLSARAWRLSVARRSQGGEAGPVVAQPRPRVLEPTACQVEPTASWPSRRRACRASRSRACPRVCGRRAGPVTWRRRPRRWLTTPSAPRRRTAGTASCERGSGVPRSTSRRRKPPTTSRGEGPCCGTRVECEAACFARRWPILHGARSVGSTSRIFLFVAQTKAWVTRPARRCKTTTPIWLRCAAPAACQPLQPSLVGLFADAPASIRAPPTPVPHLCVAVHRGAERQERRAQHLDRHRRRGERCGLPFGAGATCHSGSLARSP